MRVCSRITDPASFAGWVVHHIRTDEEARRLIRVFTFGGIVK
jgi:hypothetical protein